MVVVICLATMGSVPIKVYSAYIDPALEKVLSRAADTDLIPVDIWLYDIDTDAVDEKVKAKTGLSKASLANEKTAAELTHAEVDAYIEAERTIYAEAQTKRSNEFLKQYANIFTSKATENSEIFYVSQYAPVIQAELSPMELSILARDLSVSAIYYTPKLVGIDLSNISFTATRAKYNRDTLGLSGNGIKIGMIENYLPNYGEEYFEDANIIIDPNISHEYGSHADLVASIMVGSEVTIDGVTYKGIVPNATLYATRAIDQWRENVEWLISQGVNAINMSCGWGTNGVYHSYDRWVDHVVFQHSVHFIVASGNKKAQINPGNYVMTPALAYNAISVGNYDDNNTLAQSDDLIRYTSSYIEGGITESSQEHPMKPDLVAPGTNIITPASEDSGTSFSAPHVTGIVAQLCQVTPALKTQPATMKAILTASINHYLHSYVPDGSNYDDEYDIYGAGAVNAYESYRTAINNMFITSSFSALSSSGTVHTHTFTTSATQTTTRISLAWLNPISFSVLQSHNNDYSNNEYNMAKLNLRVCNANGVILETCVTTNNIQIIELNNLPAGTYTIYVNYQVASTKEVKYGLAVWTTN